MLLNMIFIAACFTIVYSTDSRKLKLVTFFSLMMTAFIVHVINEVGGG